MEHSLSSTNIEIKLNIFERPIIYESTLMVNDAILYLDFSSGKNCNAFKILIPMIVSNYYFFELFFKKIQAHQI